MKLSKTSLDDQLKERFVTDVYVVGLATDVCVCRFFIFLYNQKEKMFFLLF